ARLIANLLPKVLPKKSTSLPLDFFDDPMLWQSSPHGLELRKNLPGGFHRPPRPENAPAAAGQWPLEQCRAGQEGRSQRRDLPSPDAAAVRRRPDCRGAGDG